MKYYIYFKSILWYNIYMKKKETYKSIKSKQNQSNTKKFKEQYFEYYDDIKSHTHNVYDW